MTRRRPPLIQTAATFVATRRLLCEQKPLCFVEIEVSDNLWLLIVELGGTMAKAMNLLDAQSKALLAEIVYSNDLKIGPFAAPRTGTPSKWIATALLDGMPRGLKRGPAYAKQSTAALQKRYGKILKARRSKVDDNRTGADMCAVRDSVTGRFVLSVDGTAMTGGNPGEGWHDLVANLNNFVDPDMTPKGALLAQINVVEGFLEDFCQETSAELAKKGQRVSPAKIAAMTDLNGHSLGALVSIHLMRRRKSSGKPIGEVVGWSPPAEGGLVTVIPIVGALYAHLLDGDDINILTTTYDIARLAGARPAESVFQLGGDVKGAVKAHMIYRHTAHLDRAVKELDDFLDKIQVSAARAKALRQEAFLFRSSRPAEAVLRLPFGRTPAGRDRHVYVSEFGGSLITGGPVTVSQQQYRDYLQTNTVDHVHPVHLALALDAGRRKDPSKIPEMTHTVGRSGVGKFALIYEQKGDYQFAYLRAYGRRPSRQQAQKRQLPLTSRVGVDLLDD